MPEGSLTTEEIDRKIHDVGFQVRTRIAEVNQTVAGLIIAVKNFTRDTSQNVDDPTLPVNPAYSKDTGSGSFDTT